MRPTNQAAWLPAPNSRPLRVSEATYTEPGPNQVVVKNRAIAVNPLDGRKQLFGSLVDDHITYPAILGSNVAGEVVEAGNDVARFKVGDRVLAHAAGSAPAVNDPIEGAFQLYTVVREHLASPIPEWMGAEEASVLPLSFSTAAYGLLHQDYLELGMPTTPRTESHGKAVIITRGVSDVGSCAIQLAVAAGYTVYSTSAPRNFEYVRQLGATRVFDSGSASWINDAIVELQGTTLVGGFAIGEGSVEACIRILSRSGTVKNSKFIAFAGVLLPPETGTNWGFLSLIGCAFWRAAQRTVLAWYNGVSVKFIEPDRILHSEGVLGSVYRDFLPRALAERQFVPAIEPEMVGSGLDQLQRAIDIQMMGTTTKKPVVSLPP